MQRREVDAAVNVQRVTHPSTTRGALQRSRMLASVVHPVRVRSKWLGPVSVIARYRLARVRFVLLLFGLRKLQTATQLAVPEWCMLGVHCSRVTEMCGF